MGKPTPHLTGEWHAGCDSPAGRQIVAEHSNGETYCIATAHAGNGRDASAIALKMAAADDMLTALEQVLAFGDDHAWERARLAVAKARGRT